jgi:hypothetical protein
MPSINDQIEQLYKQIPQNFLSEANKNGLIRRLDQTAKQDKTYNKAFQNIVIPSYYQASLFIDNVTFAFHHLANNYDKTTNSQDQEFFSACLQLYLNKEITKHHNNIIILHLMV